MDEKVLLLMRIWGGELLYQLCTHTRKMIWVNRMKLQQMEKIMQVDKINCFNYSSFTVANLDFELFVIGIFFFCVFAVLLIGMFQGKESEDKIFSGMIVINHFRDYNRTSSFLSEVCSSDIPAACFQLLTRCIQSG